jgi:Ca2+-binding EF-hand superfamily protein
MTTKSVLAFAVLAVASTAVAQPAPIRPTFAGIDADKDGAVTQAEVAAWLAKEGPQYPQSAATDFFNRWDTNKDGAVSQAEFDARPRPPGGPPPG